MNKKLKLAAFVAVGLIAAGATNAATKAPAANKAPTAKEGKTHGDWKISCEKNQTTKQELCFLQQGVTATEKDKQTPVATYQFRYGQDKKELKLIEVLPQGILLEPGTSLIVGEKIVGTTKFTICQNSGCIAVANISGPDLETILSQESISVGMFNQEGKQLNLPFSTKGLKDGLEDLKSRK